jgi:hypothetical protein
MMCVLTNPAARVQESAAAKRFQSYFAQHGRTALVLMLVFAYLLTVRTWNVTEVFELLGDQILYWSLALRPWHEQSLGGGPSSVGGTTIGPAFMWTMWAVRHIVGPWTGNLPHAGAIGLSIVQSIADALLVLAIWKRFASLALALAVTLFTATAPQDMSLSASIWNPPLAVAFVKMSMAFVLAADRSESLWRIAVATGAAILAVQCHSSAVFFAVPAILSLTGRELRAGRRTRALHVASTTIIVALFLEAPYLLDRAMHLGKRTNPALVVASVAYTIEHPAVLRPRGAFDALVGASRLILIEPWAFGPLSPVLVVCAVVAALRMRHDLALVGVTIGPLVAAVAGFSFWQQGFEYYWFMTLMPSVALMLGLAFTAWKRVAGPVAISLLLLVIVAQPERFRESQAINRLPTYGVLVRGSREIRRRTSEVRTIDVEFAVAPSTNTNFIYERVLNGRVTSTAPFAATIRSSGEVVFRRPSPSE